VIVVGNHTEAGQLGTPCKSSHKSIIVPARITNDTHFSCGLVQAEAAEITAMVDAFATAIIAVMVTSLRKLPFRLSCGGCPFISLHWQHLHVG